MSRFTRIQVVVILLLGLLSGLLSITADTRAQVSTGPLLFPETGHTVEGDFLRYFEQHGGVLVFGYPITQPFFYNRDGCWVQYFQNGRLEVDPADGQIRLSALEREFHLEKRTPPISENDVLPGGQFFEPTGHSVILAFLDFYAQYGGPQVFGYPIAELADEDGRLVQYFERCKLEWRPELPDGQRVQLSRFGEASFQSSRLEPSLLNPAARVETITQMQISAAVRTPVLGQHGGEQIIYVYVRDQLGQPVVGARVEAVVLMSHSEKRGADTISDQTGTAVVPISIPALAPGELVSVQIKASYQQHEKNTATAFRIWW